MRGRRKLRNSRGEEERNTVENEAEKGAEKPEG